MQRMVQQLDKVVARRHQLQYLVTVPETKQAGAKHPLILFLHGVGERGSNIEQVTVHGIPKIVAAHPDFPFITVSPQCPDGGYWPLMSESLITLLDEVIEKYDVDERRVYLTGLSMGGYGVWQLALTYPHRFAAIAPICGGSIPNIAYFLQDVPVWVFHGDADLTVSVEKSREMVAALEKCGSEVRYTEYPGYGHDAWTETYNNMELYDWFLQHTIQPQDNE